MVGIVVPTDDAPAEIAEAAGWSADLLDRRCKTSHVSKRMQTDMRTARRARIELFYGTADLEEIGRSTANSGGAPDPNIPVLKEPKAEFANLQ